MSALLKIEALNPAPAREPQADIVDTWIRLGDLKPAPARDPQDGTGAGMGLIPKTPLGLRRFPLFRLSRPRALAKHARGRAKMPRFSPQLLEA